jgi:YHS domain-containing protein
MSRPRERLESLGGDRAAAPDACPERPLVQPPERGLHLLEVILVAIAEREVTLLLEDLACGGGLRPVRHRVGRDDARRHLGPEAVALGDEGGPRVGQLWLRHREIVRRTILESLRRRARWTAAILLRNIEGGIDLAIAIDPVCGMEVDTDLTDLKLEHEGKTYWFCGKGCLLEFKDDPAKYIDPNYKPSM